MSFQNQVKSWSLGDQLIAGGSVLLLVAMFLPWYSVSLSFGTISSSASVSGFHNWGLLTFIGLIVLAAFWAIRKFAPSTQLPAMPVKDGYILLGLAAVEVVGALLFLASSGGEASANSAGFSAGISWGWFVAAIAIAATAAGAFLRRDAIAPAGAMSAVAGGYYGASQQGGYGAPQQGGYGAPQQGGYGAPQQGGYGAPQGGYGAPQSGYQAPPNTGYQAPPAPGGPGDYPPPPAP